ncbi:MAG TPA: hypothetical protein VN851_14355 [Thermoanaerobaculia bacterium]|nr:hypothetical protein [Thermoanaerobaculia bacterium]
MRIRGLAFVLFALFSAPTFAQNLPQVSPANPGTPAEAPFLSPGEQGAAPVWLTVTWCSQFDHDLCHYIPHPAFPDECCIPSPQRVGCFNYCVAPPIE